MDNLIKQKEIIDVKSKMSGFKDRPQLLRRLEEKEHNEIGYPMVEDLNLDLEKNAVQDIEVEEEVIYYNQMHEELNEIRSGKDD